MWQWLSRALLRLQYWYYQARWNRANDKQEKAYCNFWMADIKAKLEG